MNMNGFTEEWALRHEPSLYMPMLQTADTVAKKYKVSREAQDEYSLQSQQRTAAAQQAGRFDAEIVPMPSWKYNEDKKSGKTWEEQVTLTKDEGNRPDTTLEGLLSLKGVLDQGLVDHRRQQLAALRRRGRGRRHGRRAKRATAASSRWASTAAWWSRAATRARWASARCSRCRACSSATASRVDDIGLWELNEAFAVQTVYCRDTLGIPQRALNVDGGAISIGHPYGVSGARMAMHALIEGKRQGVEVRRRHDVHRRRHGRGRAVRGQPQLARTIGAPQRQRPESDSPAVVYPPMYLARSADATALGGLSVGRDLTHDCSGGVQHDGAGRSDDLGGAVEA